MNDAILTSALIETRLFDAPEPRRIFDVERVAYLVAAYESARFFLVICAWLGILLIRSDS